MKRFLFLCFLGFSVGFATGLIIWGGLMAVLNPPVIWGQVSIAGLLHGVLGAYVAAKD